MSLAAAVAARSRWLPASQRASALLGSAAARPATPVCCRQHGPPALVAHTRTVSRWDAGPSWAAQPGIVPLAPAPARAFASTKGGKKKTTFKLAKKLLRVRNDAVPFRKRQKRAVLMNYAQYAINYPFESHWCKFVPHRLAAASGALADVYRDRYDVDVTGTAEVDQNVDMPECILPEPGVAELADAYHSAAGDPDALLKLMQAGHASQSPPSS